MFGRPNSHSMSGQSSPSNSNSAWPDGRPDTIFFESAPGPAPVSMATYEQTGDLTEGSGHQRPLMALCIIPELQSRRREDYVRRAKRFAKEQSVKFIMHQMQEKHHRAQVQQVKRAQALLLLSRIYVGSIAADVTEEMLTAAFQTYGTVKACNMGFDNATRKHKGYAFVEFELAEAATLAIDGMNGYTIGGRNLKVSRPSNISNPNPVIDELVREGSLYSRVYVANVHPQLTEFELRSVFEAFGSLVSCKLEPDPTVPGVHCGFGFIEYSTPESAIEAISAMHGFDLGGQLLKVGRAITPPVVPVSAPPSALPAAAAVAAANITAQLMAQRASVEHENDFIRGQEARRLVMRKLMMRAAPPRVLLLRNMVTPQDLDEDLESEVSAECAKFGSVQRVVILEQADSVRVFVEFEDSAGAEAACRAMAGRFFGGREVRADLYEQELWEAGDLTQ
uniref:Poly(U)-binding-splicing factor PUF60 n=1 Tax=Macrostomum lignano TaxID=282301 RepID=A0A1I8H9U2_9PLAT